jgi:ribokinase
VTTQQPQRAAGRVVVLGSANVDTTFRVQSLPAPGETVLATAEESGLGGKGANQAVAAALLGARVDFIGAVGGGGHGRLVQDELTASGVDTSGVLVIESAPTGAAYITVDGSGENTIVVVPGANALLTPEILARTGVRERLGGSASGRSVGLSQGEVPPGTTDAFAALCHDVGAGFVLNLAPAVPVSARTLELADPLVVNEGEAAQLLGISGAGPGEPLAVAARLARDVARSAVVTLGAGGAVASDGRSAWHAKAPRVVDVVDTTGAGDAFVGALAAVLARGAGLAEAVRVGVEAGSAAVRHRGTTAAYRAVLPHLTAARLAP